MPAAKSPLARIHAILPAAGHSTRMGTPKLLLPWGHGSVIESLLRRLQETNLASISILIRSDDSLLQHHLDLFARQSDRLPLHIICAESPPAEMRDSVSLLLDSVTEAFAPGERDAWMLVPADSVAVSRATLELLIDEWRSGTQDILIPLHATRRGHPAIFAWRMASRLEEIPPGRGVNWLSAQPECRVREIAVDDSAVLADLDTPDDYRRWHALPH